MLPRAVLFLICFCGIAVHCTNYGRNTVTNEDIRDAILQVVNVVRATEDKLERHEYRERVLGENLKKAIISIDKRIKLLDPFKGMIGRIDERLATVETILMQKDEKERVQLQKTYDAVEDIQQNLPQIVEKLKNDILNKLASTKPSAPPQDIVSKKDFDKLQKDVIDKLNNVVKSINKMETDLSKINDENKNVLDINNKSATNLEKVKRQLDTSEQLLEKYESKLAEYNNKIPQIQEVNFKENDWKTNFQQSLEVQKSHVAQILSDVKGISSRVNKLPNKSDIENAHNITLKSLEELKETTKQPDITSDLDQRFKTICTDYEKKQDEAIKSINTMSEITESLTNNIATSYDQLKGEIINLGKGEQVMMQTADSVLDTKRKVEYGVHQILSEVSQLIKAGNKDVSEAINERFDTFEMSVLDEENGALANFTSKIAEEIDQVWRQIGIMHQQMSASTDSLDKLQSQTDVYVNGSLNMMDKMKSKVTQITERMTEVDENLNYLVGKLSLVNQEFNKIKTGLGKALEELRGSFKSVDDKIEDLGPGPHKITSNEVDPA